MKQEIRDKIDLAHPVEKARRLEREEKKTLLALKPKAANRLIKAVSVFLAAQAPDAWLDDGLEYLKGSGLSTEEAIAARVNYCLTSNCKYQNSELLKEVFARVAGKVKLQVEYKRNVTDEDTEFEGLSPEELQQEIDNLVRKAKEPLQLEGEVKP